MDERERKLQEVAEAYRARYGITVPSSPQQRPANPELNAAHQAPTDQTLDMHKKMQQAYQRKNQLQQAMDGGELAEQDIPQAIEMMKALDSEIQGVSAADQQRKPELFPKIRQLK
jgi:hypothetical protein